MTRPNFFKRLAVSQRIFLLAFVLLSISVRAESPAGSAEITVGVSVPLTGDASSPGVDIKNALIFANEYFFHGRYKFIIEDDRCEARPALTAAEKLSNFDKVKYVLGLLCNTSLLAAAPIYDRAGTLVLTTGGTTGDITGVGKKIFRLYPADQYAASVLYHDMAKRHKRIGIITQTEQYRELMERTFRRENKLDAAGVKLIFEQIQPTEIDFKLALLRLKSQAVDAMFFNASAEPGYIQMVKQANSLGLSIPHYANIMPGSLVTREALGTMDEGTKFSDMPFALTDLSLKSRTIFEAYIARFGKPNSAPSISALAIDSLRLLDAALASGQKT